MWQLFAGLAIFLIVYWKDRDVLRIDKQAINNFLLFMLLVTMFRLVIFSIGNSFGLNITSINKGINKVPFWLFAAVFWEDCFYAIPIYYIIDKWKWSKYIYLPIIAALSINFGLGHMYQFELAFFVALIIPYGVFYRYGRKYGFGTTMICHILFDMITFLTFKMSFLVI